MSYSYFTHPRFVRFRKNLGHTALLPGVYLTYPKPHALLNAPNVVKYILARVLPTLFIEADLSPEEFADVRARAGNIFGIQGTSYTKPQGIIAREGGTFIVDLTENIEAIENGFDRSLRKQLNKQEGSGMRIARITNLEELRTYYDLLRAFRDAAGFRTSSWEVMRMQWETLHGGPDSGYEVFGVWDQGGVLRGGIGLVLNPDEKSCIEVSAVRGETSLPVMDFLRACLIRHAKERGMERFDLAGVDPHAAPGSKEAGIYQYKLKWGGTSQTMYAYETYLTRNRWYYPLIYILLRWTRYIKE